MLEILEGVFLGFIGVWFLALFLVIQESCEKAIKKKKPQKPLCCLFYLIDYTKDLDYKTTTVSWVINKEDMIVVIEFTQELSSPIYYLDKVRVCSGCYPKSDLRFCEKDFVDVTDDIAISESCVAIVETTKLTETTMTIDMFQDIEWKRYLTKQRKFFPNSLKKILFAWLLCCKRLPLCKDLRYMICDYIVENWKMLSN